MYTLEIPLNTKGYDDFLAKRFKYGYKLKRAVTNWINCQEHRRVSSEEYKSLSLRTKELAELKEAISKEKDKTKQLSMKETHKELSTTLKADWIALNDRFGLNSGKFIRYKELGQATAMYERYAEEGIIHWSTMEILSQTVKGAYLQRRKQGESSNHVSIGRLTNFTTLWYRKCNNNVTDEGVFFETGKGRNDKLFIPFAFRREQEIKVAYALEFQKLALYALKRTLVKGNIWKYSILLVFDGVPYGLDHELPNKGNVEIKLSVEQMAITAARDNETIVYDLSNDFGYSKRLADLDRAIESKRRALNPDNYDENGVPKKGKRVWVQDSAYKKLLDQKHYIWHKVKKARKNRFGRIANQILMLGDTFTLYQEDFKSLQSRKDYNPEEMSWFDQRKQKGFEIMFNAPYEFVAILENKLSFKDLKLNKIKHKKK